MTDLKKQAVVLKVYVIRVPKPNDVVCGLNFFFLILSVYKAIVLMFRSKNQYRLITHSDKMDN